MNPNITENVVPLLSGFKNIHLIEPLEYEPFIYLLQYSYLVLTDSGGIQKSTEPRQACSGDAKFQSALKR